MKVDCHWMESNMEAFFSESLNADDRQRTESHLQECPQCREQVEQLESVVPMVRQLFRHEMTMARMPRRRRSLIPAVALALPVAAALLLVVYRTPQPVAVPPALQSQSQAPAVLPAPATIQEAPPVAKVNDAPAIERTKPEAAQPDQPNRLGAATPGTMPDENATAFMVIDPAGYSRSLSDYHGYVLIFGLWSLDKPATVTNMEKIYEAFGNNTRLRVLGVTLNQQAKPPDATFPTAHNQNSTLLRAKASQVVIVDGTGKVRMKASLLGDSEELMSSVKTTLTQLGIR